MAGGQQIVTKIGQHKAGTYILAFELFPISLGHIRQIMTLTLSGILCAAFYQIRFALFMQFELSPSSSLNDGW